MKSSYNSPLLLVFLLLLSSFSLSACSSINRSSHSDSLPVLSQDELIRPYTKLGRIQISREMFGADYSLSPDIKAWGLAAIRHEADKMGADAIMLPEVTGRTTSYGVIPSTEYIATGFAIKFK